MKLAIYTSCSLNYLPKARALAESVRRYHPTAELTLCFNDIVPASIDLDDEPFHQVWTPQDLGYGPAWIFKHNVMELCTAVKGRALLRLLSENDADFYIYLDPDVYLFHDFNPISDYMSDASIGLTPHILSPEQSDVGVRLTEMSVTEHGIYNLGHLIVRKDDNAKAFAAWWAERLDQYCYDDRERGLFTDQRWVDLAPSIFDGVKILRVANLNVASWNLFGRQIKQMESASGPRFEVNGLPLITYHFSGTGPTGTHQRVRGMFDSGNGATAEIERIYESAIAAQGQDTFAAVSSGYDRFDDGTRVSAEARKLYRRHADLERAFANPYATDTQGLSFVGWLRSKKPHAVDGIHIDQRRYGAAFADLFDENFYLSKYPEAKECIERGQFLSAEDHYCSIGSSLLMDPNEFFVSTYYLDRSRHYDRCHPHPAQNTRESTLLWHYITTGLANGLEPIEFFDSVWYTNQNADVAHAMRTGAVSTPLAHFLKNGSSEGRNPGPGFSAADYLDANPGARLALKDVSVRGGFGAYVRSGGVDGRIETPSVSEPAQ